MKKIFLILFMSFMVGLFGQTPGVSQRTQIDGDISALNKGMLPVDYNFTSFASRSKMITPELLDNTLDSLENHPDFGILPPDASCIDCYELISERTPYKRKFIRYGTNGTVAL
jgi:hypothetical protein